MLTRAQNQTKGREKHDRKTRGAARAETRHANQSEQDHFQIAFTRALERNLRNKIKIDEANSRSTKALRQTKQKGAKYRPISANTFFFRVSDYPHSTQSNTRQPRMMVDIYRNAYCMCTRRIAVYRERQQTNTAGKKEVYCADREGA